MDQRPLTSNPRRLRTRYRAEHPSLGSTVKQTTESAPNRVTESVTAATCATPLAAKEVEDTSIANHAGEPVCGVRATQQAKGSQRRTPDVGESVGVGGGCTRRHGPSHLQALATFNWERFIIRPARSAPVLVV